MRQELNCCKIYVSPLFERVVYIFEIIQPCSNPSNAIRLRLVVTRRKEKYYYKSVLKLVGKRVSFVR